MDERTREREREQTPVLRECILADRLHGPRPFFSTRSSSRLERSNDFSNSVSFHHSLPIAWKRAPIREWKRDEREYSETLDRISTWENRKLFALFRKVTFFERADRFDKNVPGPWMRRIGGKGGGRGGVFFSRRVEEARKTLAHSFERDV